MSVVIACRSNSDGYTSHRFTYKSIYVYTRWVRIPLTGCCGHTGIIFTPLCSQLSSTSPRATGIIPCMSMNVKQQGKEHTSITIQFQSQSPQMPRRTTVLPSIIPVSNEDMNGRYVVMIGQDCTRNSFPISHRKVFACCATMSIQVLVFFLDSFDSLARNTVENSR